MKNGANLEFTYTRSKAAVADGLTFSVEWSDSLASGSWTEVTATGSVVAETSGTQSIRVTLPASNPRSFVRLRVSR